MGLLPDLPSGATQSARPDGKVTPVPGVDPSVSLPQRHSLSEKDPTTRRAVCSVCGPVDMRSAGKGGRYWQCANKKSESHAQWAKANPEKAAANRATSSDHRLTQRDEEKMRGVCDICGPVDLAHYGKGLACGVRDAELRGTSQAKIERCIECGYPSRRDNPVVDGRCTFHPRNWQTAALGSGAKRSVDEFQHVALEGLKNETWGLVPHQYVTPSSESAVPRWRVLGESVPKDEAKKWADLLKAEGL